MFAHPSPACMRAHCRQPESIGESERRQNSLRDIKKKRLPDSLKVVYAASTHNQVCANEYYGPVDEVDFQRSTGTC